MEPTRQFTDEELVDSLFAWIGQGTLPIEAGHVVLPNHILAWQSEILVHMVPGPVAPLRIRGVSASLQSGLLESTADFDKAAVLGKFRLTEAGAREVRRQRGA